MTDADKFNVLDHELVPLHEKLPAKEAEALLKKHEVTAEQLPRILVTDPAAQAVGAKAGDILKIRRQSQTAGDAISYRYVVEG